MAPTKTKSAIIAKMFSSQTNGFSILKCNSLVRLACHICLGVQP
jgi:hypothetical protein